MRRAALLLALAACDGQDSLGQLGVAVDGKHYDASSCVLSTAASQHRPHGLYIYAELPIGTLEIDVAENGQPDPSRVIYRELDPSGAETYRSTAVTGQVTLLGPAKERRGDFALVFANAAGHGRKVMGSFAPTGKPLPLPPDPDGNVDDGANNYDEAIDTGCEAASDSADSEGCDGSGGSDSSSSGCDGSGGESASGCDSGGGSSSGCSGDAGGGCAGDAHAATVKHIRVRRASPLRIVSWLLPYALVGIFVRAWRRRLLR